MRVDDLDGEVLDLRLQVQILDILIGCE